MGASSRRALLLLCIAWLIHGWAGCRQGAGPGSDRSNGLDPATPALFTEVTAQLGLPADAGAWPDGSYFLPEITGAGIALFDFDGDGRLDILQLRLPPPGKPDSPAPNRLFRQEPGGGFVDVTAGSGLGDPGYGQGLAIGDVDSDGDPDLYLANYGPDAFYRNEGDGTFTESTEESGFPSRSLWSSAATFCDYDGDGDLDLYVLHYLRYEYRGECIHDGSFQDYCGPASFDGVPDALFRNDGDGTFTEVTDAAGLRLPDGGKSAKGLGVVCTDLTRDGRADFFVANDGQVNQLWVNRGDGTFSEEGILRGVAVNRHGSPEASMGVTVGDINHDGYLDLFMTHLVQENNRLYCGTGGLLLQDRTVESRLSQNDLPMTGWGCGFLDYDHDGDLDLAVVNGRVYRGPILPGAGLGRFWNRYAEPNFLYENDGSGIFSDASEAAGAFASRVEVTRGLALGDLDNDGDLDLALTNCHGNLRIFRNDAPRPGSHWLRVRALTGPRDALGSQVTVVAGDRRLLGLVLAGSSYQASNDPRVHFGLGTAVRVEALEVLWPDGSRERFPGTDADREITLHKGKGKPL